MASSLRCIRRPCAAVALMTSLLLTACGDDEGGGTDGSGAGGSGAGSTGGEAASGGGGSAGTSTGGMAAGGSGTGEGISALYPNDENIASHPSVIFHSDFENGFAGWDSYTQDTARMDVEQDATTANGGSGYLRASITRTMLESQANISAQARVRFNPED